MSILNWKVEEGSLAIGYLGAVKVFDIHIAADVRGHHLVSFLPGETYTGRRFRGQSLRTSKLEAESRTHNWLAKAGLRPY